MPSLNALEPPEVVATLQSHLRGTDLFKRIDEMEYVGKLSDEDLREFADTLLNNIKKSDIDNHLQRAMTTSAGLISSVTTSRKSREYTRTWVLFQAIIFSCGSQITQKDWANLERLGKTLYRTYSQEELTKLCRQQLTNLQAAFNEKRRVVKAARKQLIYNSVVRKVAKTGRKYRTAYVYAHAEQKKVHSQLIQSNLKALTGGKQAEINTNFLRSGINFEEHYAPQINTLVEDFTGALTVANDTIEKRHNFKRNLAKNAFGAIKNYAPPPFNLIGVAGQAGLELGSKIKSAAEAIYEEFGESVSENVGEQTWSQIDKQKQRLAKEAVERSKSVLTRAENWINGDAGQSDFNVENFDIKKQFQTARNGAYLTLIAELLAIPQDASLYTSSAYSLKSILHRDVTNNTTHGNLSSTAEYLERTLSGAFDKAKSEKLEDMQARLDAIKLAVWNPCTNPQSLKRYYLLFIMGMYLETEHTKPSGADESRVLLKVEKSLKHLMQEYNLVHSAKRVDSEVTYDDAGISLPYSHRVFASNNSKDYVRFDILARIYAASKFTPVALMCGRVSVRDIEHFLKTETGIIESQLTTRSGSSSLIELTRDYPEARIADLNNPPGDAV